MKDGAEARKWTGADGRAEDGACPRYRTRGACSGSGGDLPRIRRRLRSVPQSGRGVRACARRLVAFDEAAARIAGGRDAAETLSRTGDRHRLEAQCLRILRGASYAV